MKILGALEELFEEEMRTPLEFGEKLLKTGLTDRSIGWRHFTCTTFLTTYRLISEVSTAALELNNSATAAGSAIGGEVSSGSASASTNARVSSFFGKRFTKKYKDRTMNVRLAAIQAITPMSFKLFGFIPTPNRGILIIAADGSANKLYFGPGAKRDEWLAALQNAQAQSQTAPPESSS